MEGDLVPTKIGNLIRKAEIIVGKAAIIIGKARDSN